MRHLKVHSIFTDDYQYANSLPLDAQPVRISNPEPQQLNVHPSRTLPYPFTINEKQIKYNLLNFKVDAPIAIEIQSAEFMHPFSCKVLGPRGSGKTSFTVSYIQKVACFRFPKIFIVTASPNQPLYEPLKENPQNFFITLEELGSIVENEIDVLIVLDDMMKEACHNGALECCSQTVGMRLLVL